MADGDAGTQSHETPHELVDQPEPAPTVVVFDIGEVLIDETRVWSVWADLVGVSPLSFAAALGAAIVQGGDHLDVFEHVAPNVEWLDLLDEHEERYGGFHHHDLYADVLPCLEALESLDFRIVIAGNQPAVRSEQLRGLGLPHESITTSVELGAAKPDAEFFDALMRFVDVEETGSILYVGDRVDNDIVPASASGMRTCWLRRGPWGLLQDLADGIEPDLVLEGLGELPTLLTEWRG